MRRTICASVHLCMHTLINTYTCQYKSIQIKYTVNCCSLSRLNAFFSHWYTFYTCIHKLNFAGHSLYLSNYIRSLYRPNTLITSWNFRYFSSSSFSFDFFSYHNKRKVKRFFFVSYVPCAYLCVCCFVLFIGISVFK